MSESMTKFVAGSFQADQSSLMGPSSEMLGVQQPNQPQYGEPFVADLNTADAQYERYKHLMRNNFYNLQANSTMRSNNNELAQKYQHSYPFTQSYS